MRVVAVDPERPEAGAIEEAVRILRAGGLVAFPTETVYGLGARALDSKAVARVFSAKGRPSGHPLIAHVEGEEGARAIAAEWNERASRLARAFWPGPLTIVVPRGERVPAIVAGGGDSIAVRAPAHEIARALLRALGEPLAAPSANKYQTLSPTTAAHVAKSLGSAVDLILDGGACTAGIESTVVDVRAETARILRPGALDVARLRTVLSDMIAEEKAVAADTVRASPGMDARHYAPRARVFVATDRPAALRLAQQHSKAGIRVGLVLRGPPEDLEGIELRVLADEPVEYARDLFATLHALDDTRCEVLVIEDVPAKDDRWWAVADRLRRASAE